MQVPFDQIMGKSNPLKLPDVAAVEAGCFLGLNAVEYTILHNHT